MPFCMEYRHSRYFHSLLAGKYSLLLKVTQKLKWSDRSLNHVNDIYYITNISWRHAMSRILIDPLWYFHRIYNTDYQYLECWHCITATSQKLCGVSNHRQLDWLFESLFRIAAKRQSFAFPVHKFKFKCLYFILLWWPVLSPLKRRVMQKMSPCLNITESIADQLFACRSEYSIYHMYLSCIKCTGHDPHVSFVLTGFIT